MKFLKFVIDYENQGDVWEPHANEGLGDFLYNNFQLPTALQTVITSLTLSLNSPSNTPVRWALPRVARHLTSVGVFGPGFGAVIPKWGGGAEIAQVACRAGAVGGGIYILGTGVKCSQEIFDNDGKRINIDLSNGENVQSAHFVPEIPPGKSLDGNYVARTVSIVSSPLNSLFKSSVEGAPLSAVSVVVVPSGSVATDTTTQETPIYIMVHSSETGECPTGQCKHSPS